jgi:hypothetical protein
MIESYGNRRNDDYLRDVSRGAVVGARNTGGYGEKVTSGADSGVLWSNGTYSFPPAAGVQLSVVSTSANDTAAGTGVRQIVISYLDATLVEHTEVVTLNGLTPVLTVATDVRFIQTAFAVAVGSGQKAAGVVSMSASAVSYSEIPVGHLRESAATRMVPKGKKIFVTSAFAGSISGTAAAKTIVRLGTPTLGGFDLTTSGVFVPVLSAAFQDSSGGLTVPCPIPFTEGQTIGMTFETDKAATVIGSWSGYMENIN